MTTVTRNTEDDTMRDRQQEIDLAVSAAINAAFICKEMDMDTTDMLEKGYVIGQLATQLAMREMEGIDNETLLDRGKDYESVCAELASKVFFPNWECSEDSVPSICERIVEAAISQK
jgi:hypothetical protein